MKNVKMPTGRIFFCLSAIVLMLLVSSCSQKVTFINSAVVPAAEGAIKISKDNNGNRIVDIQIERLADPERLSPPKKVYVVWMETKNSGIIKLGRLVSESSFFSSTLKAEMHAVTPFEPTKIFITAEDEADVRSPNSGTVLTTKSF